MYDDSCSSLTDSDDDDQPAKTSSAKRTDGANANELSGAKAEIEIESENTVYYHLYQLTTDAAAASSPLKSTDFATLQAFACNLSKDYIWSREPFRLFSSGLVDSNRYFGCTNYDANVEDEWFIVYMLYEISKNFPDLVIKVTDSDGQFLLIEAADYVPAWLEGDVADNRVFIFRGDLHIVPLPTDIKPLPQSLSASSFERTLDREPGRLFKILQEESLVDQLLAPEMIRRTIWDRIGVYPAHTTFHRHRANCVLPAKLAYVLNDTGPFFVPAAVHLACQNDAQATKKESLLTFSSGDLVLTSVTFSKLLYAKLYSSKLVPNYECKGWRLPEKHEFGYKANELGMKLTKGFELLCSEVDRKMRVNESEPSTPNSWDAFLDALHILGYFEGTEKGTKPYDRLIKVSKLTYDTYTSPVSKQNYLRLIGSQLSRLLSTLQTADVKSLRHECHNQDEDDDDWLTMTPEKLDALLDKQSAKCQAASSRATVPKTTSHSPLVKNGNVAANGPSVIAKNSVRQTALCNGGEPADDGATCSSRGATGVNFDPDTFADTVKKMLDLHIPHDGDDSSDMESYGDEISDLALDEKSADAAKACSNDIKRYMNMLESNTKSDIHQRNTTGKRVNFDGKAKPARNTTMKPAHSPGGDSIDFEDDSFSPVNIDNRLVADMLESYFPEACGQTSSASSLLHGNHSTVHVQSGAKRGRRTRRGKELPSKQDTISDSD